MIITTIDQPALIVTVEKETEKAFLLKSKHGLAWIPKRCITIEGQVGTINFDPDPLPPTMLVLWKGPQWVLGWLTAKDELESYAEHIYKANPDARTYPESVYLFQYNPLLPIAGIMQVEGIDMDATDREFRKVMNDALGCSYPVYQAVEFQTWDEHGYKITAFGEQDVSMLDRWVMDKFINMDWIRYTSAEAHAKALANATNQVIISHVIILPHILVRAYGITIDEANALVEKYKDEKVWSKIRFTL